MKSVHEPGPNGDSKTLSSRKTRLKNKPGARAPKLAQLAPRRAHGCAPWQYRGQDPTVSWPRPWPFRRLSCRIAASLPHAQRASARAPAPVPARPARLLRAQRRIVGAVSRAPAPCHGRVCAQAWPYRGLPCDTVPSRLATLVTIHYVYCDTNAQPSSLPQSQYTRVYYDTNLPSNHCPSCCVTIQFLCIKT